MPADCNVKSRHSRPIFATASAAFDRRVGRPWYNRRLRPPPPTRAARAMSRTRMPQTATAGVKLNFATDWTYAPAPETAKVEIKPRYDLFIDGKFVAAGEGRVLRHDQPREREEAGGGRFGDRGGRRPRRQSRAHARTTRPGRSMPAKERGKYIYRIARMLQERAREFAIIESMDGGKPIREIARRRCPARRRPLLLLRGLGGQARVRVPRQAPDAARRRRAGHPVEFPAADGGVEDRARAGDGQHGRPQARRDDAAHRAEARGAHPATRTSRRASSTSSPAPARPARRSSIIPASTRSPSPAPPKSARSSRSRSRRRGRSTRSSSAAKPPTSSSTTPRSIRPSRGSSTASSSTRATSAAPARGCSCRNRSHDLVDPQAEGPHADADRRRSARQEHRHRRDQLARCSSRRSTSTSRSARTKAPRCGAPSCDVPEHAATSAGRRCS